MMKTLLLKAPLLTKAPLLMNDQVSNNDDFYEYVASIFNQANKVELGLLGTSDNPTFKKVQDFIIIDLIEHTKIHTLFSIEGLERIVKLVFDNVEIRDFVLMLNDRFFIYFSDTTEENKQSPKLQALCRIISSYVFTTAANNSISPKQITTRLETALDRKEIINRLMIDKWLITVVLLYLTTTEALMNKINVIDSLTGSIKQK